MCVPRLTPILGDANFQAQLQCFEPLFSHASSENQMEPASPAAPGSWGWLLEKLGAQLLTVLKMSVWSGFRPHRCFGCPLLQGSFSEHGHTNVKVVSSAEQGMRCTVTAAGTLILHKWGTQVNGPISCSSSRLCNDCPTNLIIGVTMCFKLAFVHGWAFPVILCSIQGTIQWLLANPCKAITVLPPYSGIVCFRCN